jgi:hypothetical protein
LSKLVTWNSFEFHKVLRIRTLGHRPPRPRLRIRCCTHIRKRRTHKYKSKKESPWREREREKLTIFGKNNIFYFVFFSHSMAAMRAQ